MRTNDDQLYELYQKIYSIVEFAEFEIDDEDLRTVTDAVIEDLELDERVEDIVNRSVEFQDSEILEDWEDLFDVHTVLETVDNWS